MRFIKPSYEVLELPDPEDMYAVYKHLERVGRVCYKSEERITDKSCIEYLEMLRNRKHWAMLEHYIFVLSVPADIYASFISMKNTSLYDADLAHKIQYISASHDPGNSKYEYLISGSATAFNYLWGCEKFNDHDINFGVSKLLMFMYSHYSSIINHPYESDDELNRVAQVIGDPMHDNIHLLTREEIEELPVNLRLIHDSMSVKFTVNRGVTHELVRHRPASWAQESTRYVNYGKKGCTFIIPLWLNDHDKDILLNDEYVEDIVSEGFLYEYTKGKYALANDTIEYLLSIMASTEAYERLLNMHGWVPQQARSVLPNDTKAEIIMTARLLEWRHFFDMRAEGHAHVQMREVVCPLLDKVGNNVLDSRGVIFCDQRDKYIDRDNASGVIK